LLTLHHRSSGSNVKFFRSITCMDSSHTPAESVHKRSYLLFAFAFFSRNERKVAWIPRVSSRSFARGQERNFTSVSVPHLKGPSFLSQQEIMDHSFSAPPPPSLHYLSLSLSVTLSPFLLLPLTRTTFIRARVWPG